MISCRVCGRTLLLGERSIGFFTAHGDGPFDVCELCATKAHRYGLRPTPISADELGRRRRNRPSLARVSAGARELANRVTKLASRRRRVLEVGTLSTLPMGAAAVPMALARFNESEHARMLAGLYKTLGAPRASVTPRSATDREVVLTVAWDIVWYQFRVALDAIEANRGTYLSDLPTRWQTWNCHVSPQGHVALQDENVLAAPPARRSEPARS